METRVGSAYSTLSKYSAEAAWCHFSERVSVHSRAVDEALGYRAVKLRVEVVE